MKKPILSVIIPAHNEARYIKKCLVSLFNQSFQEHYEVIVVDNNSTDDTKNIARTFPVRVVSEIRKGPCVTRNTGAKHARSDILVYVDADYVVPHSYLQNIYSDFKSENNIDIIAGAYSFFDGPKFIYMLTKNGVLFGLYFLIIRFLFGFQYLTGGNFAIRKKTYLAIGGFREDYTSVMEGDDIEFAMRLAAAGYKSKFNKNITSYTSMRRLKKYNVKDQFMRQFWFIYHVLSYRFPKLRYPNVQQILK